MLDELGAKDVSDGELQALVAKADLDDSQNIGFREFLIAVALGYYLKEDVPDEKQGENFAAVRKGFVVVRQAFDMIDIDHGGTVDPEELKVALFGMSTTVDAGVLEDRFGELDFDHDGAIDFPEFLHGFVSWINMSDDEEDDGDFSTNDTDENTQVNSARAITPVQ
jgi:calcium-binding protein CML